MSKYIGKFYKHSQSQLSTPSIKEPVILSSNTQTSSAIELTTTSIPSVRDKNQNNSVLCSQNSTQNDLSLTNNEDIQSFERQKKQNYSIPTTPTPNHRAQRIDTTSASMLNLQKLRDYLRLVKNMCFP